MADAAVMMIYAPVTGDADVDGDGACIRVSAAAANVVAFLRTQERLPAAAGQIARSRALPDRTVTASRSPDKIDPGSWLPRPLPELDGPRNSCASSAETSSSKLSATA